MKTPAQRHLDRMNGALRGAQDDFRPETTAYQMQLFKLRQDKMRLKQLQSRQLKTELKKTLVTEHYDWCQGVVESNAGQQDDVLITVLVWLFDIGDFKQAYPLACYALQHNMQTPDQYKRKLPTLIAEEVANSALMLIQKEEFVDADLLVEYLELTRECDMPDEVRAKLYKAIGLSTDNLSIAINSLEQALICDPRAGVKKKLEQLLRTQKNNKKAETE